MSCDVQLIQDALESQKKVMLLAENEKQLKAQVSFQRILWIAMIVCCWFYDDELVFCSLLY